MQITAHLSDPGCGPKPPWGLGSMSSTFFSVHGGHSRISVSTSQGARCRRFLALMVGALGSPPPASHRGPLSTFLSIDGRRSWISSSGTSQGGRRQHLLALMVGAPGSPAPALYRGASLMFLSVDGGRSRISSSSTSYGVRRRRFLALMVGTFESPAPPPRGLTTDVL
jgi:hypothetical protein